MLRDIHRGMREISSEAIENSDLIKSLKRNLDNRSFDKIVRILDEAIEVIAQKKDSIYVPWGCVGSMFGDSSNLLKHGDVEYLWEKIIKIMGPERFCMMTIGSLLMWRVAFRAEETDENWLATKTEYEEFDLETNQRISRYEYFIGKNKNI